MSNVLNFQQAIAKMQAYLSLEDLVEKFGSVSVNFEADWTGSTQSYVIDTQTDKVAPRLFSLETGHIIDNFEFPNELSEEVVENLEKTIVPEFQEAYQKLQDDIKSSTEPEPEVPKPSEPEVVEDPESLGLS